MISSIITVFFLLLLLLLLLPHYCCDLRIMILTFFLLLLLILLHGNDSLISRLAPHTADWPAWWCVCVCRAVESAGRGSQGGAVPKHSGPRGGRIPGQRGTGGRPQQRGGGPPDGPALRPPCAAACRTPTWWPRTTTRCCRPLPSRMRPRASALRISRGRGPSSSTSYR